MDGAKDIIPRRLRRSKLFRRSKGSKSASTEEPEYNNPTSSEEEYSKSFTSEDTAETVIHYSSEDKQSELDQYIFSNDSKESADTTIHDETVKISRRQRCKAKLRKCLSSKTLKAKFSSYNISSDECVELGDEIVSDSHINENDHVDSDNHDDMNNDVHLDNIVSTDNIAVTDNSGASGDIYQKKQWSVSDYSLSIYSQDGIDTIVVSPKEKEINDLKAKLFNKELESKRLRSKISQLSSEPTLKSVSESESVIYTAFETKKVSEVSSDTPSSTSGSTSESVIHTPLEITKVSHRQRYRAKIRQCLSSTQELMAPLKALHPNNRAERGHTKQQARDALEALQNAPMFFESVPFESTEEGEAPTFYCPRHGTCSSHFAWCFCDYHPSAAHRQSERVEDWLLPAWRASVTRGIEEDRAEKARIEEQARMEEYASMEEHASKEEQARMEEQVMMEEQARMEEQALPIQEKSEPQRFSAEEYIDLISDLTDDYLGYSRSKPRSHKRSKSKKRVEGAVEEKMEEKSLPIQEHSEPQKHSAEDYVGPASDRTDDYLGVTGYNPRTGTLDKSKRSKKNKEHRRVRWASTEKGWESKAVSSSSPSAECTKENEKMEVPFLA